MRRVSDVRIVFSDSPISLNPPANSYHIHYPLFVSLGQSNSYSVSLSLLLSLSTNHREFSSLPNTPTKPNSPHLSLSLSIDPNSNNKKDRTEQNTHVSITQNSPFILRNLFARFKDYLWVEMGNTGRGRSHSIVLPPLLRARKRKPIPISNSNSSRSNLRRTFSARFMEL